MTTRFFRLLACQLLLLFACAQALAADTVDIVHAHIEASEEGYKLQASYSFDLTHDLEDALLAGIKRKYNVQAAGSIYQSYATLDEALLTIRRPGRWVIGPRGALKPGEIYNVSLRMFMDRQALLKPLQVNAINNAGWQLSSGRKTFMYRAE